MVVPLYQPPQEHDIRTFHKVNVISDLGKARDASSVLQAGTAIVLCLDMLPNMVSPIYTSRNEREYQQHLSGRI